MLLLPIRTNLTARRTPYANYALIAINVVVFFLSYSHGRFYPYAVADQILPLPIRPWAWDWMLTPARWQYLQFVTYAFLHGSVVHILGNMFFLYLFGNNINDKLGHFWYVAFYLLGAVFSGVGHTLVNLSSLAPTLGASGAVAAVTGAYLVLFPQTLITVLYWFFFIGTVQVPALYFIGFKMILFDNVISRMGPGVAYDAHLAGYAYGIAITLFLVYARLISTSDFDLWSMIRQWDRRRRYRDAVARGYDPYAYQPARKRVPSREVPKSEADQQREARVKQLRRDIDRVIAQRSVPSAADLYVELMQVDPEQVLPRQHLLDISNQLASDHRPAEAARAYRQFLMHYGSSEYAEQVELMLGILYARYLSNPQEAIKHLRNAAERLTDPGQLRMCRDELARLGV